MLAVLLFMLQEVSLASPPAKISNAPPDWIKMINTQQHWARRRGFDTLQLLYTHKQTIAANRSESNQYVMMTRRFQTDKFDFTYIFGCVAVYAARSEFGFPSNNPKCSPGLDKNDKHTTTLGEKKRF